MNRLLVSLLCLPLAAALPACQRQASPVAPVAASDGLDALTHELFPTWKAGGLVVLNVPSDSDPKQLVTIAATPVLVVKVDPTHRALVMVGTPSDEQGHESASHAQGGNLGAYGFELRGGRWVRTTVQDSVLWTGQSGALGDVKSVDLGAGHMALSVESGWTGQGYDVGALDLIALEPAGARVVLSNVRLHSDSLGVASGCEQWLDGGKAPAPQALAELTADNCFDVSGTWGVQPLAGGERGDIVITFDGHRLVTDPRSQAKSVQAVAGTLVYRYSNGSYAKVRGENLAPEV